MQWSQVFLVWFVIIIAETLHGILRTLYIIPIIGDHAARQIGVLIGSILIFRIAGKNQSSKTITDVYNQ